MIKTNPVSFDSVERRNDVHDAVKGRAQALADESAEMHALFALGQTLGHVEENERPDEFVDEFPFVFRSVSEYETAVDALANSSDPDLEWLSRRLDAVGVDETPISPGSVTSRIAGVLDHD